VQIIGIVNGNKYVHLMAVDLHVSLAFVVEVFLKQK